MVIAGYSGILEVLLIALAALWLFNAYKRATILKKIDQKLNKNSNLHRNESNKRQMHQDNYEDVEDADFEELT